jgi:hypothetical protein
MLTERERDILSALSSRVRMLSFEVVLREWWPPSKAAKTNARLRLSELVEAGLLVRERALARPLLPLAEPVFRWKPGEDAPACGELSWAMQKRWTEPAREIAVYLATRRAAAIFGGKAEGRIKNLSQVTHDIHLAALYLRFRREAPTLAAGWVGEEIFAPTRERQKLPDAMLYDGQGRPRLVVEFGGAYPTERVKAFHEDCAARGLPYELW